MKTVLVVLCVLWVTPAAAQDTTMAAADAVVESQPLMAYVPSPALRRSIKTAIVANGVLQTVDLAYTEYLIGAGLGQEANPLLRWAAAKPGRMGLVKGGVAFGAALLFAKLAQRKPKTTLVLASVSVAVTGWVVLHNKHLYDDWTARGLLPRAREGQ